MTKRHEQTIDIDQTTLVDLNRLVADGHYASLDDAINGELMVAQQVRQQANDLVDPER